MAEPLSGGTTTLGSTASLLDSSSVPMRQIIIHAHLGTDEVSIGNSDVTADDRTGFVDGGGEFKFGPFEPGIGIRPNGIYLLGTAGQRVTWSGVPS